MNIPSLSFINDTQNTEKDFIKAEFPIGSAKERKMDLLYLTLVVGMVIICLLIGKYLD